jgi:uncharacterized protein YceK
MMQISRFLIKLTLVVAVTLLSAGCTPLILKDLTGSKANREIEISRSSDELIAIGTIGNKEVLKQFPEAIALVGKAQSYILLKGAKDLQALTALDGILLKAADTNGNELKPNLPLVFTTKDREFFGTAWFIYKKKTTELSIAEKQTLSTIQTTHTMRSDFTRIGIRVSGIIPEKEVTLSDAVTRFKAGRQIALIQTEKREEWVRYPNPFAIFGLPFAIIGDAIILPILIVAAGSK